MSTSLQIQISDQDYEGFQGSTVDIKNAPASNLGIQFGN